jgi:uncharacterized membrane protein YbhN (UPF0104 family)
VRALFDAVESFFEYLDSIVWSAVALALACHLAKIVARTRSWRNILAAAYPEAEVRWRSVLGAYLAGLGVNAVLPARGGDVLKLYLVKHRIEGATYPTLASSLLVETIFDFTAALVLLAWALQQGVLPGLDVLPRLPSIDWLWLFQSPRLGAAVAIALLVAGFAVGLWASRRIEAFWQRVRQGFAILRQPRRYVRGVVAWQALDWALRLATIYFFLVAFGLEEGVREAFLVQVTQSLSTILPLTPAGLGTEQALLVYVFAGEQPAGALLSFSVGMKLILVAANVALGFAAIVLMLRTVRWRRAVAADDPEARAAAAPGEPGS